MVYITGDTHGDFRNVARFCERMQTEKSDILIILGDAGINYYGGELDAQKKKYLESLPITIFAIHGNHEVRPQTIPTYHEIEWNGGTVYVENQYPHILFAKDGELYDIGGQRTFVIGGAYSVDKVYAYAGKKVCILNFASATNPGGGVTKGSSAQEEAICRCSTLYANLKEQYAWNAFYAPHRRAHDPLHNDDCIYTPGVMVFKSDTDYPQLLPEEKWYSVNVLTCAAPNLRERPSNEMNAGDGDAAVHISREDLQILHEKRMRRVLEIAWRK